MITVYYTQYINPEDDEIVISCAFNQEIAVRSISLTFNTIPMPDQIIKKLRAETNITEEIKLEETPAHTAKLKSFAELIKQM